MRLPYHCRVRLILWDTNVAARVCRTCPHKRITVFGHTLRCANIIAHGKATKTSTHTPEIYTMVWLRHYHQRHKHHVHQIPDTDSVERDGNRSPSLKESHEIFFTGVSCSYCHNTC